MRFVAVAAAALSFICIGAVQAENINKEWQFQTPSKHFPVFFSSEPKYDVLLNDYFRRHWFSNTGMGAYSGNQNTAFREWNALTTAWIDTSKNKVFGCDINAELRNFLLSVQLDRDGYVYSYPPASEFRDKFGCPFPNYQNSGGLSKCWDWNAEDGQDGWKLVGGGSTGIGENSSWSMMLTEPNAYLESPKISMYAMQSPIVIVQLAASVSGTAAIEWTTEKEPTWNEDNRVEFAVKAGKTPVDFALPLYQYPGWRGKITAIRIRPLLNIPEDGVNVWLDRVQCAYDTRQVVNNTSFILASWRYFLWTGDGDFLKQNMGRIRAAAHYMRNQLSGDSNGLITIPYWGQDGTSGIAAKPRTGYGISSDTWSLPMGYKSAYTNAYYVAALRAMVDLETASIKLNVDNNPYGENAASFKKQLDDVTKKASDFFWDNETGRFIGCVDSMGKKHDNGFVYLNLEALYYGLGDSTKAASIYSWLDGTRIVKGDTSTGKDIYAWRFAPRSTTKHNADWYCWMVKDPQTTSWGSRIVDGGATAYTSFYDVMDRIKFKSTDDAYSRLKGILDWYNNVWDAGGYRNCYAKPGLLQGNGTLGSLGIDSEFIETSMAPLSFLYGFLGIDATLEGLSIAPKIPQELDKIGVQGISYHGVELTIVGTPGKIYIQCTSNPSNKTFLLAGRRVAGTFERTVDASSVVLKPGD